MTKLAVLQRCELRPAMKTYMSASGGRGRIAVENVARDGVDAGRFQSVPSEADEKARQRRRDVVGAHYGGGPSGPRATS